MKKILPAVIVAALMAITFTGCEDEKDNNLIINSETKSSGEATQNKPLRDSTPLCLVPTVGGARSDLVFGCDVATVDASNSEEGYVIVNYFGTSEKVKLKIIGPDNVEYVYTLHGGEEVFPFTAGNGDYNIKVYEIITGDQYAVVLNEVFNVNITNQFGPYLYPNQYVNFKSSDKTITLGSQICKNSTSELETVEAVYNYVVENITYDKEKAMTVQSGYLPVIDETVSTKTGICFDYAAVMASMLRSQRIPTRMELGYVDEVYHAWISTYITDIGWVNGIIAFDGESWTMMDPTFAATSGKDETKDFVGNGTNYQRKFVY